MPGTRATFPWVQARQASSDLGWHIRGHHVGPVAARGISQMVDDDEGVEFLRPGPQGES